MISAKLYQDAAFCLKSALAQPPTQKNESFIYHLYYSTVVIKRVLIVFPEVKNGGVF
jgi:hypothetical protein